MDDQIDTGFFEFFGSRSIVVKCGIFEVIPSGVIGFYVVHKLQILAKADVLLVQIVLGSAVKMEELFSEHLCLLCLAQNWGQQQRDQATDLPYLVRI